MALRLSTLRYCNFLISEDTGRPNIYFGTPCLLYNKQVIEVTQKLKAKPVAARVTPSPGADITGSLFAATLAATKMASGPLELFLAESSVPRALLRWLGETETRALASKRRALLERLDRDIALIDELLNGQVNAILHHPQFQRLESAWCGLRYLTLQTVQAENVKVRVINLTWKELARDLERAIEFDQSQLFQKVYSDEFGTPGGEPFGVLIGDYEIRHRPSSDHPIDDIATLRGVAQVAAAAFAPFITGVHPALFGLDDFHQLGLPINLSGIFQQLEYLPWRSFRESDDARFVGLVLPRVLMRAPYQDLASRVDRFLFRERVETSDSRRYLWGNAAYSFASVLVRSFTDYGWFADIRGVRRGEIGGGMVTDLTLHAFTTDRNDLIYRYATDVLIAEYQDKELAELGFIPLCHIKETDWAAFYTTPSLQHPKKYDTMVATANARLSAMLQYMFCVSRFGHTLKIIGREMVGSFKTPAECEAYLHRWLMRYVTSDEDVSPDIKAKYPLREASIQVRDQPGKPGSFICVAHLRPHFQIEQITSTVKLVTELSPSSAP